MPSGELGRGAGADRREDPQHDRVEARAEDEFGGGELGDAVRAAWARHSVLRGRRSGLRGPVLRGAADLDETGAAAAAAHRLADGGDGDGVVPGQIAGAAAGGARAVDDDPGVDGVQEAGECSWAATGQVEPYVGVVAAAERGQVHGGVGEQPVGHEPAEESIGSEQQNPHRAPLSCRRRAAGAGDWGVMSGVSLGRLRALRGQAPAASAPRGWCGVVRGYAQVWAEALERATVAWISSPSAAAPQAMAGTAPVPASATTV